ncbi:MAG: adenylate/guanylate cyclase domain-containing protein [Candidatus Limnocylindrales bacterium]
MLRRGGSQRFLTTVLFTDIVGSTERAAELGDRGWKELVARHHAIVRRELRAFHGRELDTAGDGFFAIFDRPAQAIECATSIMDRLVPLGLTIRAAIHTGETEVMGDKVGGITVHVASRALALAAPGEILVTRTVREVAAGADVTFQDRGLHEFKGVPEEWDLYAVEWRRRELPTLDEPGAVTPTRRRTRWLAAFAVVIVGGVVIAVSTYALLPRGQAAAAPSPQPDSAMRIDAAGAKVLRVVPGLDTPTGVAVADGTAWVLVQGTRYLTGIPPGDGNPKTFGLPGSPTGIAVGDGAVWITFGYGATDAAEGIVLREGTGATRDEKEIPVGNGVTGIAVGERAVWVVSGLTNSLVKIDPATRAVTRSVTVGEQPVAVTVGEGSIWVAHALGRSIWRIDPSTMEATAKIPVPDPPRAIALGFKKLWVASDVGNSVAVIDVATNLPETPAIPFAAGPRGIAAGPDAIWVACGRETLARIDPATRTASRFLELPGAAEGVAVSGNEVWVTVKR